MDHETRRVGQIEAEIVETRTEMAETIEAIQDRLTPANIVANAKETVRHAATEKVKQMTDNTFMDTIRANPVPAAMIGLGAAWLYAKGRSNASYGDSSPGYRSSGDWRRGSGYSGGGYNSGGSGEYAVGTRGLADYEGTSETGAGLGDRVSSMGRDVSSRARDVAEDVRDSARQTTRRAQVKFNDVLRDSPLLLGAAAALVGMAIGMTIPASEVENQLMGDARDAVVDRAQDMASDAASKVSDAVGTVQQEAQKAVNKPSPSSSDSRS
jgi:hypothetical protein